MSHAASTLPSQTLAQLHPGFHCCCGLSYLGCPRSSCRAESIKLGELSQKQQLVLHKTVANLGFISGKQDRLQPIQILIKFRVLWSPLTFILGFSREEKVFGECIWELDPPSFRGVQVCLSPLTSKSLRKSRSNTLGSLHRCPKHSGNRSWHPRPDTAMTCNSMYPPHVTEWGKQTEEPRAAVGLDHEPTHSQLTEPFHLYCCGTW